MNEESEFTNATLVFMSDRLVEEDDDFQHSSSSSSALQATQTSLEAALNNQSRNDTCPHHQPTKIKPAAAHDLTGMLMTCARAVSAFDTDTANRLLTQIRAHSSPRGTSSQRVAHVLANALEARVSGPGRAGPTRIIRSTERSASALVKAYKMCVAFFPTKKVSMMLANRSIERMAPAGPAGGTLHVIDFGSMYGFQWPRLIQALAARPGGPPKLRITGIEFPVKGESPGESLRETGRCLARFCERFGVPFEYNAIARVWQSVEVEDLKIRKGEVVVANCMFRFHNLLDETVVVEDNPRDKVLRLIKESGVHMFVHGVLNGQYNSPFFMTRFLEAFHQFSNLFDMLEVTVPPQDDEERRNLEEVLFGKIVINVLACEGRERVERPETYKSWGVRMRKAGFRQLSLDQETVRYLRGVVRKEYHRDLYMDEDRKWIVLGWKGRINDAVSCWTPRLDQY